MRNLAWTGALLGALLALPAAAQQPAAVTPIAFDTFTLGNGLKFIVHEDHSTPIAAVNVWYHVGSANEVTGRSGFAHLFEHMLFQETQNLEKGEYMRLIQAAGGDLNGSTWHDRTNYFETLPSNRLNLALWLEADRMARLQVTEENFTREREVVKEERRMRIENVPYAEALGITLDTLANDYPPYDHPGIGSMEDLDAATAEDVRSFYKQFYVPNNATVVVAGDVTTAQVRELAERYFGPIPRGSEPAALPPPTPTPRTSGERRQTVEDKLANTPAFAAGYNTPPRTHEDSYALELLSRIFSTGESSRLHQRLVKDEKAALVAGSFNNVRKGPGTFLFFALPNQGVDVEKIEALVDSEIDKLKTRGVTRTELEKAKNQLRAERTLQRQRVESKAELLNYFEFFYGDPGAVDTDLRRYLDITLDDIREVARKYLVPANRTVIIVVPPKRPTAS